MTIIDDRSHDIFNSFAVGQIPPRLASAFGWVRCMWMSGEVLRERVMVWLARRGEGGKSSESFRFACANENWENQSNIIRSIVYIVWRMTSLVIR